MSLIGSFRPPPATELPPTPTPTLSRGPRSPHEQIVALIQVALVAAVGVAFVQFAPAIYAIMAMTVVSFFIVLLGLLAAEGRKSWSFLLWSVAVCFDLKLLWLLALFFAATLGLLQQRPASPEADNRAGPTHYVPAPAQDAEEGTARLLGRPTTKKADAHVRTLRI